ncbi:MAG: hypothetical protein PF689_09755 [Deltaproteobacteria bacterium]|jgi:hypothetical protein|nr:hypothetical protein [Deltaproteobacteria bacterium]
MKKFIFGALLVFITLAISSCVVEDSCDCFIGDGPICLNSVDLADSCDNDCDWDVVDCDLWCYDSGYDAGDCYDDGYTADCDCYYY